LKTAKLTVGVHRNISKRGFPPAPHNGKEGRVKRRKRREKVVETSKEKKKNEQIGDTVAETEKRKKKKIKRTNGRIVGLTHRVGKGKEQLKEKGREKTETVARNQE